MSVGTQQCGSGSGVEHLLAKEKVAGSNPVSRSIAATSPSGKARVCKTLITGSNPVVASEDERNPHKLRPGTLGAEFFSVLQGTICTLTPIHFIQIP